MPSALDLAWVALVAIGWPLYEHFVDWPRFLRRVRESPGRARIREYRATLLRQWTIALVVIAGWIYARRAWAALGLVAPGGWRLWASILIVAPLAALYAMQAATAARSGRARAKVRAAVGPLEPLLPHSSPELAWFLAACVTAGVCEELFFRGYFVWTLAPWVGWWGAVAVATPVFGLLHAYQGRAGVVRTAIVGLVMALVVALTRTLLTAMALHALVDLGAAAITWLALREAPATGGDAPAEPPAQPRMIGSM